MAKLNNEQKDMIKYFWREKGNMERYACFEELKPLIAQELPEVLMAWENYKAILAELETASNILDAVVDTIPFDNED